MTDFDTPPEGADQADDFDQADPLELLAEDLDDDAPEPMCCRVVLRRLVDALTASLEASQATPDPELAAALDVARGELEWTA